MNGNISDLTTHVKTTLKEALTEGFETTSAVGPLWGEKAVKVHIALRATQQDFLPPEDYAWVCGKALNHVLTGA